MTGPAIPDSAFGPGPAQPLDAVIITASPTPWIFGAVILFFLVIAGKRR
jgi:hypothetical protein